MTMSSPRKKSSWNDLSPWEKAAQWHNVAPHIADKIMALAEEATRFDLAAEKEREIHRLAASKEREVHQLEMEKGKEAHRQEMERRTWWTQVVALGVGFLNVTILAVVAWHYADTGSVVPGLAVFGAGAGLTAGAYGVGRAIGRRNLADLRATASGPSERIIESSRKNA